MKKLLSYLLGASLVLVSLNVGAEEKKAPAPERKAPAPERKAPAPAPAKKAPAKKAPAKKAPVKCAAQAATFAKASAALVAANKAITACKAKFKRTHLLRCRKVKKAKKAAIAAHAKAFDNHQVCLKGCSYLKGIADKAKEAHAACKKKNKWTHLARCRKPKKRAKKYDKLFAQCQRFRNKK